MADLRVGYMDYQLKPNYPVAGPALGAKRIKEFAGALAQLDAAAAAAKLEAGEEIAVTLAGQETMISKDLVNVTITAREGFTVEMENNLLRHPGHHP